MKNNNSFNKGFTLIELLVVISIISILSVVVFVALDPIKRFQDSRNARRYTDIQNISSAIQIYQIDHEGVYPDGVDTTYRMLGTDTTGCDVDCEWQGEDYSLNSSCLDLSSALEKQLKTIPQDPQLGSQEKTYYAVAVNSEDLLHVIGCAVEGSSGASGSTGPTCTVYTSSDVPVSISSSGTPTVTSTLSVSDSMTITDVNVTDLYGDHTYIGDLNFNLKSPAGTEVRIMDNSCGDEMDFDIKFDDDAPSGDWPCPPTDGNSYQPDNPLSSFNGENSNGTWTLTINDTANADGGSLEGWAIEICN